MPKLTVLEQVRYLATLKGMDAKEIKENSLNGEEVGVKGKLTDKIKSRVKRKSTEDSAHHYSDS